MSIFALWGNRGSQKLTNLRRPKFGKEWYAGCTTSIVGNSIKAGVRFLAFDAFKSLLADENGNISGPKSMLAGLGAGVTESLLAVTPFESIKTQIIDDRKSGKPRMKGFLHGSAVIFREKGVGVPISVDGVVLTVW